MPHATIVVVAPSQTGFKIPQTAAKKLTPEATLKPEIIKPVSSFTKPADN